MKTLGISPKAVAAVVAAVATYLVTQTVLELDPGIVVVCQAVVIAVSAWAAGPGNVVGDPGVSSDSLLRSERGQYDPIHLLVVVIVVIVLLFVLLRIVDHI